jgi:hypothetical protein
MIGRQIFESIRFCIDHFADLHTQNGLHIVCNIALVYSSLENQFCS